MEIRFFRPRRDKAHDGSDNLIKTWLFGEREVPDHEYVELWQLDEGRRKVAPALWPDGRLVVLAVEDGEEALKSAVVAVGEGLYRLIARGVDRRRVAKRDFEAAATFTTGRVIYRSTASAMERMAIALATAKRQLEEAQRARGAAEHARATLERKLAMREEQIDALRDELDSERLLLARLRRPYDRRIDRGDEMVARRWSGERRAAGDDTAGAARVGREGQTRQGPSETRTRCTYGSQTSLFSEASRTEAPDQPRMHDESVGRRTW